MAVTTVNLTFNVSDLIGDAFASTRRVKVWIESNVEGDVILDTAGNKVHLGNGLPDKQADGYIAADGTGQFTGLIATNSTTNPTAFQYRVWVEYDKNLPQQTGGGKSRWNSGWFSLTATSDLADVAAESYVPPTWQSAFTASVQAIADDAQASADEAESWASQAHDISEIAVDDDVVEALVKGTAGAGPKTRAALTASFAPDPIGYDIVVLAGQSNMSGRGVIANASITDPTNPRIFQWKTHGTTGIQPAAEPLDMHDTPTGIGPGLQFARWYASRRLSTNRKVLLVPTAHGGTPLVSSAVPLSWRRGVSGNLYANMLTQVAAAKAAADAVAGTTNRIVALLWCQGETDGDNTVTATNYQTDLDALVNGARTDLGVSDLPVVLLTMVPEYLTTGTRADINAIHRETPLRIARTDVALGATSSNNGDGNHYNAAGQRTNGRTMYDAYERIIQGLSPYYEAWRPGQVTGLALTPTSTQLAATWTADPNAATYLVEYRATGGSTWTSAGTTASTSMNITGLTDGTSYDVRVTAQKYGVSGTPSAIVAGTPHVPTFGTYTTDSFSAAKTTLVGESTDAASGGTAQPWACSTASAALAKSGGQLVRGASITAQWAHIAAPSARQTVSAKISALPAGGTVYILARKTGTAAGSTNDMYRIEVNTVGDTKLQKVVGGTTTQLGSTASAGTAAGDTLTLDCNGTSITVLKNGSTLIGPITDSAITGAGYAGLGAATNVSAMTMDDFKVESLF